MGHVNGLMVCQILDSKPRVGATCHGVPTRAVAQDADHGPKQKLCQGMYTVCVLGEPAFLGSTQAEGAGILGLIGFGTSNAAASCCCVVVFSAALMLVTNDGIQSWAALAMT